MLESKLTPQQQSIWAGENFRALRRELNNHLAVIMALAELSQRNSACYPKLSAAVLERCPDIVRLLQAATSEDPETFERNRLEDLRCSFKDTPPRFPSRDDSISFWSFWLSSVESYPYRIPVPNHLREAHKWLSLAERDHPETRRDFVARVEALLQPEQLDQTRLDSEAFIRERQ